MVDQSEYLVAMEIARLSAKLFRYSDPSCPSEEEEEVMLSYVDRILNLKAKIRLLEDKLTYSPEGRISSDTVIIIHAEFHRLLTENPNSNHGFERLLRKVLILDRGEICSVCLDELKVEEEAGVTECSHMFHINCISKWMSKKLTCPLCRHDMRIKMVKNQAKRRRLNNSNN